VSIRADRDEAAGRSCRVDRISGPEGRVFEIVGDKHLLRNCAVRTTEAVCAAIGPRGLRLMTSSYFGVSCTRFPARRGIPQLLSGRPDQSNSFARDRYSPRLEKLLYLAGDNEYERFDLTGKAVGLIAVQNAYSLNSEFKTELLPGDCGRHRRYAT
jgi:hypothetical protein